MSQTVQQFYDEKYENYVHPAPSTLLEHLFVLLRRFELHRVDAAVQLLPKGKRILDIGCGYGELLKKAQAKGYKELHGIDISTEVLKKCRKNLKGAEHISVKIGDVDSALNYPDRYFDAITMIAVYEHIFDPHAVAEEIRRVLKKNGTLIIEVPNVVFLPRRFSFLWGKLPKTADEENYKDGHLQFYTQDSLRSILQEHGFAVVSAGSSGIWSKYRDIWPSLLGANIIVKARKI